MGTRAHRTTILIICICLSVVTMPAAADEPTTADDFLVEFNDMGETEAFLEYSEFELVRSQAIVETQTGEFTDGDHQQMAHLLAALRAFEDAHSQATSGDREAAIERADDVADHLSNLRDVGGDRYAQLGEVALTRFYEVQAADLYEDAQGVSDTADRIEMQRTAAYAYNEAGITNRYSAITVETEELESQYERDVERMEGSVTSAERFLDGCDESCTDVSAAIIAIPETFERYEGAQTAHNEATFAQSIAADHGISDREEQFSTVESDTFGVLLTTAAASIVVVFAYAGVFLTGMVLLVRRIGRWERDVESARVPEIVSVQEVTDA